MTHETVVDFFYKIDAFRNPDLVEEIASCTGKALLESFNSIKDISKKDIPSDLEGKDIAQAIRQLREQRVKSFWLSGFSLFFRFHDAGFFKAGYHSFY